MARTARAQTARAQTAQAQTAQAQPTLRAVLRGPMVEGLVERIEGQTGDLPWQLVVVEDRRRSLESEFETAARLGAANDARVVLWVDALPDDGGLSLHFADVAERRLLLRQVRPERGERFAESTVLETIAVIVRGSLRALALGGEIGVAALAPAPVADAEPRAPPHDAGEPDPEAGPPRRFIASLGLGVAFDGHSEPGQAGPEGRLAFRRERLILGVDVSSALPADLPGEDLSVRLTRHALRLNVGAVFVDGDVVELAGALSSGVALYDRSTAALSSGAVAAPSSRSVAGLLGGALRLAILGDVAGAQLGIEVAAGFDWVLGVPRLRIDQGGGRVTRNDLWDVQPRVTLALTLRTGAR